MELNKEYQGYDLLPFFQKTYDDKKEKVTVIWENGDCFFKVITDIKSEFPCISGFINPEEEERNGIKYICVTGSKHSRYDNAWMISTPELKGYFFDDCKKEKEVIIKSKSFEE